MSIRIKDRIIKEQEAKDCLYDKDWKVSFKLKFLRKPELQAMVGRHTKIEYNPKNHVKEENVDSDKLTDEIIRTCVKGWTGVTHKWLNNVIPYDLAGIEKVDEEIPFSLEDLQELLKEAIGIDSWIIDTVKNAANFSEKKNAEVKNS